MMAFRRVRNKLARASEIAGAFTWMGATESFAYPIGLVMTLVAVLLAPVGLYFVSQLVPPQPSVGGDYFTFASIGIVATTAMQGGLSAFGGQLDVTVSTGRLENLLVEPIRWRLLPFGLAGWTVALSVVTVLVQAILIVVLGAEFNTSGIPLAILLLLAGMASGHAVGILAGSIKVLSKRSDPILSLYNLAIGLLAGTAFPVSLLPAPVRVLSYCLPQTYVLSAVRRVLMVNGSSLTGPSAATATALLAVFLIIVYPLGLWLFGRSLEYARKIGTLAGY